MSEVTALIVNKWREAYPAISDRLNQTPSAAADLTDAVAAALAEAKREGEAIGIERAAECVDPVIAARCTCEGQGSHDSECEAQPALALQQGIRALSPDPSYIERIKAEVWEKAITTLDQAADKCPVFIFHSERGQEFAFAALKAARDADAPKSHD